MTPYELSVHAEVFNEQMEMKRNETITLAWLGEYYHRTKKLPSLHKAIEELSPKKPKKMTDEEMYEQVKRLNALFGGTVEEKKGDLIDNP